MSDPATDERPPLDLAPRGPGPLLDERRLERAAWALVGLGIALRVVRYLMDFPLWWDEAFVAVNFIRRDYLDLLRPLDYGQVCPVLFLWAELSAVKLLGYSEWSLRLFPLACSAASVVLFRHAARRVLRGAPFVLAAGVFAMAYHPIRHAADVKPYASDLLASLGLFAAALEFWRAPRKAAWMWVLAVIAPVAIALSHPAIFVVGGVASGLAPAVVRSGRPGVRVAYVAFLLASFGMFLAVYAAFTSAQASATLAAMREEWAQAFPPLSGLSALGSWLATVHTGSMFAYPCGGEGGASLPNLALFVAGAAVLWRRGRRSIVLICLVPFALALAAAGLRRYPYGGFAHGSAARVMQYLVPALCLLIGVGASALLARLRAPRLHAGAFRLAVAALLCIGIAPVAADAVRPFRAFHAQQSRAFARRFWPELERGAEPVCLRWDLGLGAWDSKNLNVAVYLCNQRIYSPRRRAPAGPVGSAVSADRPLRCVLALAEPGEPRFGAWLRTMRAAYRLSARRTYTVDSTQPGGQPRLERYHVFEFVPKQAAHRDETASLRRR